MSDPARDKALRLLDVAHRKYLKGAGWVSHSSWAYWEDPVARSLGVPGFIFQTMRAVEAQMCRDQKC